ncbi:MAG: hypothetical protein Q9159_005510 [Coniocarpon cinnabarinum]
MSSTSQSSSRSSQDDATGASYNLILDHVLTNPGTHEIPLRTMYTINSTPRSQISRPATPTGHRTPTSPAQASFPTETQQASAEFQTSLLSQISKQRTQLCSLPPSFINSFLRRCFPIQLEMVDFPQALTALDYLKDLEHRRRREVAGALTRLGISKDSIDSDPQNLNHNNPGVAAWVKANETREHKVEARYTQLYIALRRWILINELSLRPFSRYNCLAMLNTLYPPLLHDMDQGPSHQPTAMLTPEVLSNQRRGFLDWIQKVEQDGYSSLAPLMDIGKRAEDENGWPAVRVCLDEYLRLVNHVIEDCSAVISAEDLDSNGQRRPSAGWSDSTGRSSRKADSGVSFTSKDTPNTSISSSKRPSTSGSEGKENLRPKTPSYETERTRTGGSTLEKLAREIRRFRSPQNQPESQPVSRRPSNIDPQQHSRDNSDASSGAARGRGADRNDSVRSKGNVLTRSFSRLRNRSRSRPKTPAPQDNDAIPPTPALPEQPISIFEDDDPDEGRGRFRRSLSVGRARSSSRGSGVVRKMKSLSDTRKGRQRDEEEFDMEEMKRQRLAWERREMGIGEAI